MINFNTAPYYDDFDSSKNFHRILFKPGVAVQARELTQAQTILQNQITSFADNIFKQNSPVSGGQITTNFNCYYIKLQPSYNNITIDVTDFQNVLLTNATGTITAKVVSVVAPTGTAGVGDPPTLIVSYKSGNHFADNDVIYVVGSNLVAQAISVNATGRSSVASISKGIFYVLGNFVQVSDSTVVLSKYSNLPSVRIGLTISQSKINYLNDTSLLDPALGASNYQAPGADRYLISLSLDTRPLQFGDDDNFIELVRVEDGIVFKMVDGSVYSTIEDYFAKRDYETNGDYIVNDFKLIPRITDPTIDSQANTYTLNVGKGLAYVHGHRVENPAPVDIISNRSRSTNSISNDPVYTGYGNYFIVSKVSGSANGFFDITTQQSIDLHCVSSANVDTSSANAYNSTLVSSGFVRGLDYISNTTDSNPSSYVYKLFVNDLQNNVLTGNVVAANATNITLPSTFSSVNDAYVGVNISVDGGEFRTITSYNGTTKTANVNSSWSVTPSNTSIFALNFDVKDIETVWGISKTGNSAPSTIYSSSSIDNTGKSNGLSNGDTVLQNPSAPELIFKVGNPYVKTISNASYTTTHEIRGVNFNASGGTLSAQVSYSGGFLNIIRHIGPTGTALSASEVLQQYTIIVTDPKSSGLTVGQIVPWTTTANSNRTVTLSTNGTTATFQTLTSDLTSFTATIVAKVYVENAVDTSSNVILKYKNLILANTSTVYTGGTAVNTYTHVDDSTNSTGQVYIENAGIVPFGQKQSLYLSDIFNLVAVIDTGSPSVTPTVGMISDPSYNVTNNYILDNGQRDSYYDHASIRLAPGAPKPKGNLLVLVNYFKHSGGDGYFSVASYPTTINGADFYRQIQTYTSSHGTKYSLRDCLDFRPARLNAQSAFTFRYSNYTNATYGLFLPQDGSIFNCDYSYYLARKDKLIITKDRNIQIIEGSPAINPIFPLEPEGSLVIANITHNPYTGYLPVELQRSLSDLSIVKVQHKRYTMQDIASLDARIGQIEYYTALSALEQSASNQQITDAYGLNRFKNGILTDDFSSFSAADTGNVDFVSSINKRTRQMSALQGVSNFPLKNIELAYNLNSPSDTLLSSLQYKICNDGLVNYFTLPYTSTLIASQPIASRVVNVNPFSLTSTQGTLSLTPNVDNWVDNSIAPSLLIVDPSLQIFQSSTNINTLSVGDWQTISGTTVLSGQDVSTYTSTRVSTDTTSSTAVSETITPFNTKKVNQGTNVLLGDNSAIVLGYKKTTTTTGDLVNQTTSVTDTTTTTAATDTTTVITDTYTTTLQQQQNNILGPYTKIGNTYAQNLGYITDISIAAWMRPQEIAIRTSGLLYNSTLHNYFDNVKVDANIRKPNIIELSNVSGSFVQDRIIGYVESGSFYPTGFILDTYKYTNTSNVRLYVVGDVEHNNTTIDYANGSGLLVSATFNSDGSFNPVANGTITSSTHFAGVVQNANTTLSTITLDAWASSTNDYYKNNTVSIISGVNYGTTATITGYNGTTKVANLSSTLYATKGDVYSIGGYQANEEGKYSGIFYLPPNSFHNGQRIFRVDNRYGDNISSVTSFAEGTFYSEGLQTKSKSIDFGASPSGAKGSFVQTNYQTVSYATSSSSSSTSTSTSSSTESNTSTTSKLSIDNLSSTSKTLTSAAFLHWDPVAQTFIIDPDNYPNGAFINSIQIFFASKPVIDKSPIQLFIVGTLNGYPNGETLDHSMVSLTPDQVNVSQNPQYLDSSSYTEFKFPVPVYIQPGVLYAFILKSNSDEYTMWTASNGDNAIPSSTSNIPPTDPGYITPSTVSKISKPPYIGGLFVSQNSQTWTPDQNQSLMFNINRCVFDTSKTPTIRMIVPKKLPGRTIIDKSINYFTNSNTISNTVSTISNVDVPVDALNLTTTDFIPSSTGIAYSYSATLKSGGTTNPTYVNPGKYGTTMYDHIYLDDNLGERVLQSNASSTFSLYAMLGSTDNTVSPVLSDAGTSLYTIQFNINNCELSNTLISLVNGGSGYLAGGNGTITSSGTSNVTVSSPTGLNGVQAYVTANVVLGVIKSVTLTNGGNGSGYIETPTITIQDPAGTGASVTVAGETSSHGGPAISKYFTKKVVLDAGFDSGDLNVFLTAYRPVNTDILVYYKILNRQDTQKFEDGSWQLMTKTRNSDTLYSSSRGDLNEYTFAPGTNGTDQGFVTYTSTNGQVYTAFSQFAIKVVLVSSNKTSIPFLQDLRSIALPANVNTSA